MAMDLHPAGNRQNSAGHGASLEIYDLDQQRLKILRCTAHAMAASPGGLRFRPGTRPWLDGLPTSLQLRATAAAGQL
ncbi:MAG: hypothetical protein JWR74_2604 [Polaromonas sp.]|nr:hypothetical protein [Polaromonas sp.]